MQHPSRSISSHQRRLLQSRARQMRHECTHTEWLLWQELRCGKLGIIFRRQVVLQGYICDFYACSARLIVEVDGSAHVKRARHDARRDRVLRGAGYRVLRIPAEEVLHSLPDVVAQLRAATKASPPVRPIE